MSTYTQDTEEITGYDIVTLKKGNHTIIPITTAEAVVWHEGDNNMTLREKIETLNFTPGETITYKAGSGIVIDNNNTISVVVDGTTIVSNEGILLVNNLKDQISIALSDYLGGKPLINTVILEKLEDLSLPGKSDTLYLIGSKDTSGNSFEEYIWIVDESVTPNGGYLEKLGTLLFDANKLETVYEAVFTTDAETGKETDNIAENKNLITQIRTELGTAPENNNSTIYDRLNSLETNYDNMLGLSFEDTTYKLNYTIDINNLYKNATTN